LNQDDDTPKLKITPKKDGAVIKLENYEIEITVKQTGKPIEHAPPGEPVATVEALKKDLSTHLEDLEISEEDENIIVKPKRFLGPDFSPIAEIIECYGGSYISDGKDSRFLVPIKKQLREKQGQQ
jgi:hypothetical protein